MSGEPVMVIFKSGARIVFNVTKRSDCLNQYLDARKRAPRDVASTMYSIEHFVMDLQQVVYIGIPLPEKEEGAT